MILTTPNLLTLIRIALVPILVCLLLYPGPLASSIAAALFLFGTVTDFLDGYIARTYDAGSNLGKFLDPLADKLLVTTALQSIAIQGLLIHYTYFHIDFFAAGMFILWLALALSAWSGVDYFINAWRVTMPSARPPMAQRVAV